MPAYVQDITSTRHYSIQEEKIKIEQDRVLEAAEEKKEVKEKFPPKSIVGNHG